MEEVQLKSTGFQSQSNAATCLLRQNYVNQYKNYYDGCFNLNKWKAHVYTKMQRVNQSWEHQYSSFGEFRENSRKVTFDDNVLFHDYIDTELENDDAESSSSTESEVSKILNASFVVNGNDSSDFQNQDQSVEIDGETDNKSTVSEPQISEHLLFSSEQPEGFLFCEDAVSFVTPLPLVQNDILTPKSDSTPNLLAQAGSELNGLEMDLKISHSDTIMANKNKNCSKPAKKSTKNRVGTPRFVNKSSYHNIANPSQLLEVGSEGKGDEETKEKNIVLNKKKSDGKGMKFIPIPIHPSATKIKLIAPLEDEIKFQTISPDELPIGTLPISQDSVYPVMLLGNSTATANQLQDRIDDNKLTSLPIAIFPPLKEPQKVKQKSGSGTKKKLKKQDIRQKTSTSGKAMTKERSMTMYIRKENARLQGQRLFNEIKTQISKHNMDKKILSTIFNKQFVALLLSGENVRKYQTSLHSSASLQVPKILPKKGIKLGSKWASKPVDSTIRMTAVKNIPAPVTPLKSNAKLNTAVVTSKLLKEKVEDKKSKPGLNTSVDKEKMKLPVDLASSSTTALKKKSPKKETTEPGLNTGVDEEKMKLPMDLTEPGLNTSVYKEKMKRSVDLASSSTTLKKKAPKKETAEKIQKRSKTKKTVENAVKKSDEVVSPKRVTPRNENVEAKVDPSNAIVNERTIIPTRIPKPVKEKRMAQSSADQEKISILHCPIKHCPEKVELLKKIQNSTTSKTERPFTAPPTNPLDYSSFDRWLIESKKCENIRGFSNGNLNSLKLSVGDERELKILRSIKRNPQMLDAYTTYRFGGPLSPTELERIMKRF